MIYIPDLTVTGSLNIPEGSDADISVAHIGTLTVDNLLIEDVSFDNVTIDEKLTMAVNSTIHWNPSVTSGTADISFVNGNLTTKLIAPVEITTPPSYQEVNINALKTYDAGTPPVTLTASLINYVEAEQRLGVESNSWIYNMVRGGSSQGGCILNDLRGSFLDRSSCIYNTLSGAQGTASGNIYNFLCNGYGESIARIVNELNDNEGSSTAQILTYMNNNVGNFASTISTFMNGNGGANNARVTYEMNENLNDRSGQIVIDMNRNKGAENSLIDISMNENIGPSSGGILTEMNSNLGTDSAHINITMNNNKGSNSARITTNMIDNEALGSAVITTDLSGSKGEESSIVTISADRCLGNASAITRYNLTNSKGEQSSIFDVNLSGTNYDSAIFSVNTSILPTILDGYHALYVSNGANGHSSLINLTASGAGNQNANINLVAHVASDYSFIYNEESISESCNVNIQANSTPGGTDYPIEDSCNVNITTDATFRHSVTESPRVGDINIKTLSDGNINIETSSVKGTEGNVNITGNTINIVTRDGTINFSDNSTEGGTITLASDMGLLIGKHFTNNIAIEYNYSFPHEMDSGSKFYIPNNPFPMPQVEISNIVGTNFKFLLEGQGITTVKYVFFMRGDTHIIKVFNLSSSPISKKMYVSENFIVEVAPTDLVELEIDVYEEICIIKMWKYENVIDEG